MTGHKRPFDLAVVGGGALGLSCAWRAAAAGLSVVLLEERRFFHDDAGSGGAERQWRLQYSEEDLTRLVLASIPLWRELETASGRRLIHETGSLWFGEIAESTNEGHIADAAGVLEKCSIPYEWMGAAEIERRFGFRDLPVHYEGFHQPDGGVIDVKGTLFALYAQARAAGADLRDGSRVLAVEPDEEGVRIRVGEETVEAEKVVISAGAFTGELLQPLGLSLDVEIFEMATAYFRPRTAGTDFPSWFAFQKPAEADSNLFYGFGVSPWSPNSLIRVAPDFEVHPLRDARDAAGTPRVTDLERVAEWVGRHLPALEPEPLNPSSCLIALPADHDRGFYLGPLPGTGPAAERVIVCNAGWMFKFAPLFGEICGQLVATGRTEYDIARLTLG
ncbi:FAD-dependent oxidoreductase [Streptomyces sp. PRh5]|uniref:FAD-dependent oxidoreductase n=1 Tax=Streptomyces TaxID=1883 RepID=UPI0004500033|nr:FAD-dependent oxidoreductase [Streptomyces sp. PRh5]EXU64839.1 FAD-dependent oxidoreductase [Streptomyces sp. PRh5]